MSNSLKGLKNKLSAEVTEIPPMFQASHLPSLDGFRGISIITVLIFHILLKQHKPYFHGDFGVEIFFVISGFIITTLLIKEQVKSRDVSLKNFYIRRILKILPIAYLYLLAITICNAYYHHLAPREIISAALFLKNTDVIPTIANGSTGHFWSLSVEEQFYIFFPFILARSLRVYLWVILSLLVILPVVLTLEYKEIGVFGTPFMHTFLDFFRNFMPILIGSLTSILVFKKVITGRFYKNSLIANLLLILLAYFLYAGITLPGFRLNTTWLSPVVIAIVLINNLIPSNDLFFRFLNSKILVITGVASYSLYVWQQVFILDTPWANEFPYAGSLWLNVPAALLVGFASYHFIEIPITKLKRRFRKNY